MTIGLMENVDSRIIPMNLFLTINQFVMKTNYQNTSMLDMIFEHRNKSYGAYALRQTAGKTVSTALLITLTSVLLLCFGKFLSDKLKGNPKALSGPIVTIDPIPPIDFKEKKIEIEKPKLPKPQQAQAIATQRNVEMAVTQNNQVDDTVPTVAQLRNVESGITTNTTTNTIGATDGKGTVRTYNTQTEVAVDESVHITVEVMPEFPGGEKKLMEFLAKNTYYPDFEKEMGIEGKTFTKFVVNEDGSISNTEIMRSESKGFSNEAKRVVALLPKFKPGMQQGRAVKVQFVLPFCFKMSSN